ncbi:MAG: hypothetical protein H6551_08990 [Chitinophagales bacterium]|nr:hypothetical protein [Chitinophagaceae bacterium]MCB9065257.1 hypothetical protein [Chitinophagales bacterium]
MDISQKIGPQTIDMTINMVSNMTFEVTDIADGIYTLKTQMNRLKMSLKNAGMDIDADSDVEVSDDGNIMQQLFSMMVKEVTNKPFVVKMNNKGNVESVKGVDTLFESAIGVLASKFPEIGEDKISATLSQMK